MPSILNKVNRFGSRINRGRIQFTKKQTMILIMVSKPKSLSRIYKKWRLTKIKIKTLKNLKLGPINYQMPIKLNLRSIT